MFIPMCPGSTGVCYDTDTQQLLVYTGDIASGQYTIHGPVRTILGDTEGHLAKITADGALIAADCGSHPLVAYDAAGADTYATILTTPKDCRYLSAVCATNPAMISIDGGSTEGFAVAAGTTPVFPGISIPAGTEVQAKNANAGNNYATLYVSVW